MYDQAPLETTAFVEALRTGDRGALEWVARRCDHVGAPRFSRWAWEWMRDDFIADLTAQLTVATRAARFEIRGSAEAYIDTAIRNLCRRRFSDLARVRNQVDIQQAAGSVTVPDSAARVIAVLDLKRALAGLGRDCREMIEEKYLHGRSLSEMALDHGVPEKTIRSRLHSCREKLRILWQKLST